MWLSHPDTLYPDVTPFLAPDLQNSGVQRITTADERLPHLISSPSPNCYLTAVAPKRVKRNQAAAGACLREMIRESDWLPLIKSSAHEENKCCKYCRVNKTERSPVAGFASSFFINGQPAGSGRLSPQLIHI